MGNVRVWRPAALAAVALCQIAAAPGPSEGPPVVRIEVPEGADTPVAAHRTRRAFLEAWEQFAGWTGGAELGVHEARLQPELRRRATEDFHLRRDRTMEILLFQDFPYEGALHGLCHAWDRTHHLSREAADALHYDVTAADYDELGRRGRPREALARTCGLGPLSLEVAVTWAQTCQPDRALVAERLVRNEVFSAEPPQLERAPVVRPMPMGHAELPDDWHIHRPLDLASTADGWFVLDVTRGGVSVQIAVDPYNGTTAEAMGGYRAAEGWPGEPLPPQWSGVRVGSWSDGARLVAFEIPLASGDDASGALYWDGLQWSVPADPCVHRDAAFVSLDGEPWTVWLDGRVLRWSRWSRGAQRAIAGTPTLR